MKNWKCKLLGHKKYVWKYPFVLPGPPPGTAGICERCKVYLRWNKVKGRFVFDNFNSPTGEKKE